MASLKHCIGKLVEAGEISKEVAAEAERLATEHVADGYTRENAEKMALKDLLTEANDELSLIYKQLGIKPVIDNLPDDLAVWGEGKGTVKAMREAVSREPYKQVLEAYVREGGNVELAAEAKAALDSKDAKRIMKMAQKIEAQKEAYAAEIQDAPKKIASETRIVARKREPVIREAAVTDSQNNPVVDDFGNTLTEEAKHQPVDIKVYRDEPTELQEMVDESEPDTTSPRDFATGQDRDELGADVPNRDITPVVGSKQIKFIKDLLTKGVPAFVSSVKAMTEQQRHNVRAATRELLKTGQLGDLTARAEAALKALRGVAEKPAAEEAIGGGDNRLVDMVRQRLSEAKTPRERINVLFDELKGILEDTEQTAFGYRLTYDDASKVETAKYLDYLMRVEMRLREQMTDKQQSAVSEMSVKAFRAFKQRYNEDVTDVAEKVGAGGTTKNNAMSVKVHQELGKEGIPATHDSPIRHEGKFNWREHKGKGEGNASFGAGTYLSTADGVHRSYKKQFTAMLNIPIRDDYDITDWISFGKNAYTDGGNELRDVGNDKWELTDANTGEITTLSAKTGDLLAAIEAVNELARKFEQKSPTYHVTVNAKPEELLDWDAPLSEQSDLVKKVLESDELLLKQVNSGTPKIPGVKILTVSKITSMTGEEIYTELQNHFRSKAKASDYLQSLGIVGHRYAANGGRNDKFPNYVIYDDSRIETNYVDFSKQQPVTKTSLPTDKEQADLITRIATLLGDHIRDKVKLVKDLKDGMTLISGQVKFDADGALELMQIALNAENINQVADHEAMHQLFAWLHKNGSTETIALIERMAQNGILRKRLEELLQDHPEAVKQLADPEEFAAYLFQFWRAGRVKLGPQNEGFFNKAWKLVRGILQQVRLIGAENTDMQDVEGLFAGFASGQFAKDNRNEVIQSLEKRYAESRRNNSKAFWQDGRIHDALRKGVYTAQGTLNDFNNPALKELGEWFNTGVGDKLRVQGFLEAKAQKAAEKLNVLTNILNGVDKSDLDILRDALLKRERPKDAVAGRLFDKVQAHLKDMRQYLKDSGVKRFDFEQHKWVEMGTINDNYFPRVFDMQKIAADQEAFVKRLLEKHPNNLKLIADQANKEIAERTPGAKGTASYEFIKGKNPAKVTAEDVARSITARLINGMGDVELDESTSALGMTPLMRSVNRRQLTWLDDAAFADYMSQDVVNTLVSYTMQSVKRAEYVKRFDNDGAKLRTKMDEAVEHEMKVNKLTQEQAMQKLAPAAQAVMALEGTLGYDINPNVRRLAGAVMTYQNWRLLITGLFGSMVDPLGIIVRGGEMQDAWNAFARGLKEVKRGWFKEAKSNDELSQLAEMLGTVDAGTYLDALGQTYSSLFMYGKLKSFNDTLFRINGLEAWNRAMRIQATGAAVGFIKKHLKNPEKDSQRWLQDELGLDPVDKGLLIDGELDYTRDDVRQAIMRWVDTSIVRPNAAMRPLWASDPHYAVFYHLKSFAYAFHKTILERVINEAKHDNYVPALYLLSIYAPVMIAADAAKELLIIGDDEPAWMKSGVSGAVKHGVNRANLGVSVGVPGVDFAKSDWFLPIPGIPGLYAGSVEELDFFGPAVDQVKDFLLLPFNDKKLGKELAGALPFGNVVRKYAG